MKSLLLLLLLTVAVYSNKVYFTHTPKSTCSCSNSNSSSNSNSRCRTCHHDCIRVIIGCTTNSSVWFKDNQQIAVGDGTKYKECVGYSLSLSAICIDNLTLNDEGNYSCSDTSNPETLKDLPPLKLDNADDPLIVYPGTSVKASCGYRLGPVSKENVRVKWSQLTSNNQLKNSSRWIRAKTEEPSILLQYENLTRLNIAKLKCEIRNAPFYNCNTGRYDVHRVERIIQVELAPIVTITANKLELHNGEKLNVTCSASLYNRPVLVEWCKNENPIPTTDKGSLIIDNVQEGDSGQYHCRSISNISNSATLMLHVIPRNESESVSPTITSSTAAVTTIVTTVTPSASPSTSPSAPAVLLNTNVITSITLVFLLIVVVVLIVIFIIRSVIHIYRKHRRNDVSGERALAATQAAAHNSHSNNRQIATVSVNICAPDSWSAGHGYPTVSVSSGSRECDMCHCVVTMDESSFNNFEEERSTAPSCDTGHGTMVHSQVMSTKATLQTDQTSGYGSETTPQFLTYPTSMSPGYSPPRDTGAAMSENNVPVQIMPHS